MPEDEDFTITYKGAQVNVSPVLNGGNIYFIVHLANDVVIAERWMDESWEWYEINIGNTPQAAELGIIIEKMDV